MTKAKAIVIEDQAILWDYIKSCLDEDFEILAFCTNTSESEIAIRKYHPDFVWLDCYLGELHEEVFGLKQSGLLLAEWIKNHHPQTKIFLFTASTEYSILKRAQSLNIEGIALGAKYIKDKTLIKEAIKTIIAGQNWINPHLIENFEIDEFIKITVFELSILLSTILGKSTAQIANELDTTRKMVNNSLYRIRQKLNIDPHSSREIFIEEAKEKLKDRIRLHQAYACTELISIQSITEKLLAPIVEELKEGRLHKKRLGMLS